MGTVSAGRMIWEKKMRGGDLEDQEGEDGELGGLVVRSVVSEASPVRTIMKADGD